MKNEILSPEIVQFFFDAIPDYKETKEVLIYYNNDNFKNLLYSKNMLMGLCYYFKHKSCFNISHLDIMQLPFKKINTLYIDIVPGDCNTIPEAQKALQSRINEMQRLLNLNGTPYIKSEEVQNG